MRDESRYPLSELLRNDHPTECDQACYRCLQRYSNQAYHGLLDWRLGLAFLTILDDSSWQCGLDGRFEGPALQDWPLLARRYAQDMGRLSPVEMRDVAGLVAFRVEKARELTACVTETVQCLRRPFSNRAAFGNFAGTIGRT